MALSVAAAFCSQRAGPLHGFQELILFQYTAQWVEPLESNVYEIQGRIYHGHLIAEVEIRRILAVEAGTWVNYRRDGEVYDSREAGEETRKLRQPPAWWERRFVNRLAPEKE